METLADTRIETLGTTKIVSDARPTGAPQGGASVVRIEPEQGSPSVFAAVASVDEAEALATLFSKLSTDRELRSMIEGTVIGRGSMPNWASLYERFDKVAQSFSS